MTADLEAGWQEKLALYLVTDERRDGASMIGVIERALAGGVGTVQLRRKKDDGRELVELGRAIRRLTRAYGALYIVNDRVDVALLTDADGVHVGQSDIACRDARALLGNRIVGVSAGTLAEAEQAVAEGADYLGVGAVFPTQSKEDADLCGLDGLERIVAAVPVPVVAIGGIQPANVPAVMVTWCSGIAVVSAIMSAADPRQASVDLLRVSMEASRKNG